MTEKHVAIIDQVGRNIIGKLVEETDTTVTLNNPVILFVQPEQNGQLQVQSFPVFFFEFIDKNNRDQNNWTYNKINVVTSDVVLDERILTQYNKINTLPEEANVPVTTNSSVNNPKVISIDDI